MTCSENVNTMATYFKFSVYKLLDFLIARSLQLWTSNCTLLPS